MKDLEDSSGLYELSGLKAIFDEPEKKDFWDGVETDFWEKEEKKEFDNIIKQIDSIDNNLTLNRENYYNEVEKKMDGISTEMSKDIFEDDFKECKETKDEIDPFWLT